jgi:hypothetical protein
MRLAPGAAAAFRRADQVGQDARQRAALADEQPHLAKVARLQRAQAAVQRLEIVERRGSAEITLVDDRHRQAPLRRVPCRRDPVKAGADHDDIKFRIRQPAEISLHFEGHIVR